MQNNEILLKVVKRDGSTQPFEAKKLPMQF